MTSIDQAREAVVAAARRWQADYQSSSSTPGDMWDKARDLIAALRALDAALASKPEGGAVAEVGLTKEQEERVREIMDETLDEHLTKAHHWVSEKLRTIEVRLATIEAETKTNSDHCGGLQGKVNELCRTLEAASKPPPAPEAAGDVEREIGRAWRAHAPDNAGWPRWMAEEGFRRAARSLIAYARRKALEEALKEAGWNRSHTFGAAARGRRTIAENNGREIWRDIVADLRALLDGTPSSVESGKEA